MLDIIEPGPLTACSLAVMLDIIEPGPLTAHSLTVVGM